FLLVNPGQKEDVVVIADREQDREQENRDFPVNALEAGWVAGAESSKPRFGCRSFEDSAPATRSVRSFFHPCFTTPTPPYHVSVADTLFVSRPATCRNRRVE